MGGRSMETARSCAPGSGFAHLLKALVLPGLNELRRGVDQVPWTATVIDTTRCFGKVSARVDKRPSKGIVIMKIMKLYVATIVGLVCCAGLVSQSAAQSSFYAKAKEEGRVL